MLWAAVKGERGERAELGLARLIVESVALALLGRRSVPG